MTKKDYELIAASFLATRPVYPNKLEFDFTREEQVKMNQWRDSVAHLSDILAADNTRFDKRRFIDAANGVI